MAPSKDLAASGQRVPPGFVSVRDILEERHSKGSLVNIIGVVIDTQAPTPTRGTDWKCAMRFIDKSVDEDGQDESISCHFFMKEGDMPHARCGDVLILHQVRVQNRQGDVSIITHFNTKFSLFTANKIPHPPADASVARTPSAARSQNQLSKTELEYVSLLYHSINKDRIPPVEEYEAIVVQSRNVRDKFRELKDVDEGFCDLIVHLVREPYDMSDKMTLWVSDYTENAAFFNVGSSAVNTTGFEDGDPYGYVAKFSKGSTEKYANEDRPSGKRSMQITCWEPHASAIRESKISKGTWVLMKNVQVKFGRDVGNLEGYLREDRGAHGVRINIFALDTADRQSMDPRHIEALRRYREYERFTKSQLKQIRDAAKAGQKRKSLLMTEEQSTKPNSSSRRQARRKANKEKAVQRELEEKVPSEKPEVVRHTPTPNLNSSVKCENHSVPPSKVAEILKRVRVETDVDGEAVYLPLPFVNMNHRVDVRVTDFQPSHLQGFVHPKKASKFDALSDNEDSDLESGSDIDTMRELEMEGEWEWQFALQLEDATPNTEPRERFWVAVDNQAAQCLTNLDASNLKYDPENLEALRQRMFYLWGDLEEQKSAIEARPAQSMRVANGDQPPPDSSDNEAEPQMGKVTNRPFSCCVKQYGIKVRESDPSKADAGKGYRWVRMFGLYGTRIAGN